jgi:hypothetical protein
MKHPEQQRLDDLIGHELVSSRAPSSDDELEAQADVRAQIAHLLATPPTPADGPSHQGSPLSGRREDIQ